MTPRPILRPNKGLKVQHRCIKKCLKIIFSRTKMSQFLRIHCKHSQIAKILKYLNNDPLTNTWAQRGVQS